MIRHVLQPLSEQMLASREASRMHPSPRSANDAPSGDRVHVRERRSSGHPSLREAERTLRREAPLTAQDDELLDLVAEYFVRLRNTKADPADFRALPHDEDRLSALRAHVLYATSMTADAHKQLVLCADTCTNPVHRRKALLFLTQHVPKNSDEAMLARLKLWRAGTNSADESILSAVLKDCDVSSYAKLRAATSELQDEPGRAHALAVLAAHVARVRDSQSACEAHAEIQVAARGVKDPALRALVYRSLAAHPPRRSESADRAHLLLLQQFMSDSARPEAAFAPGDAEQILLAFEQHPPTAATAAQMSATMIRTLRMSQHGNSQREALPSETP